MNPSPPTAASPAATSPGAGNGTAAEHPALDALDEALLEIRRLVRRPGYRARLLGSLAAPVDVGTVRVLRAVERSADASPCIGDIAARLDVDHSTASRLIDQQVTSGYLERGRDPQDRRRSTLALTNEGRHLLAEVTAVRRDLLAEVTADWTDDEVAELAALLERLRAGFLALEREQ
jgi:DNA-binding MarR family transcriptional regulator